MESQKGFALLVLVIAIALTLVTYFISDLSITKIKVGKDRNTLLALKEAKQAVINYAITYSDRGIENDYGVFPHPETIQNGDYGNMPGNVGTRYTNTVGWLPWRALDISTLKDESGTCLFYAVSGTVKLGGTVQSEMINEDSVGMFQINNSDDPPNVIQGINFEDRVVALVIAASNVLAGQVRNPLKILSNCGDDYGNVSAYLEGDNNTNNSIISTSADTVDQFIHATEFSKEETIPYNDKFLTITRDEVWGAIVKRSDFKQDMETLTSALAECVKEYANIPLNTGRRLPWPTKTDLGLRLNYRNDINYDDDTATEGYSGRYPFFVGSSNGAIDSVELIEDQLFKVTGTCNDFGLDWESVTINLEDDSSKYGQLWSNWKDHFFYIISKSYEPDNSGTEKTCADVGTSCIRVNATEYAGAVIFSGSRLSGVTRIDKEVIGEYLESAKAVEFNNEKISKTGDRTYIYTDPQTETINDVMYCIQDKPVGSQLEVMECTGI